MTTLECKNPTVQFVGLGTRLGTYCVCAAYLALLIRHKYSPISRTFQTRIYRLAEGAWMINAILLVSIFSVGMAILCLLALDQALNASTTERNS